MLIFKSSWELKLVVNTDTNTHTHTHTHISALSLLRRTLACSAYFVYPVESKADQSANEIHNQLNY